MHQDDPGAREAAAEYYFGPDLLVAPILAPVTQRAVYLPEGNWIDYWTGKRISGPRTFTTEAPLDRIPVFLREGAILPKIPDDVMTLVPALDARRVYELYPGAALRGISDFEGRRVGPGAEPGSLVIAGQPAHVTLCWRFQSPATVSLDGRELPRVVSPDSTISVEFDHRTTSHLAWR